MRCPKCRDDLETPKGVNCIKYGFCQKCGGRAFDFGLLLGQANGLYVLKLIKMARGDLENSRLRCPKCRNSMKAVFQHHSCANCQIFWIPYFEGDLKLKAREAHAEEESREIADRVNDLAASAIEGAGKRWNLLRTMVPSLHAGKNDEKTVPTVTYLLSALMLTFSLVPVPVPSLELAGLQSKTEYFTGSNGKEYYHTTNYIYHQGTIRRFEKGVFMGVPVLNGTPDIGRMASSFFFHFSMFPLVLSLLILSLFGVQVERHIGSSQYALLVAISYSVGFIAWNLLASVANPKHFVVGSMSGIAGILGFYTLAWFLGARPANTKYRPLLPLVFGIIMVGQAAQTQAEFGGYTLSYGGIPWFGFMIGAFLTEVFA